MTTVEDAIDRALEQYSLDYNQQQQLQMEDQPGLEDAVLDENDDRHYSRRQERLQLLPSSPLTAAELIALGSVLYLPACAC